MFKLLKKEISLASSPLSYLFIAFSLMVLIPNYPALMSAFFICFGIFQSFQTMRDNNDITYSALLPISKTDVVKAKFAFCLFIELCGFAVVCVLSALKMTVLADVPVYRDGALMRTDLCFLGFMLVIFAIFNAVFIGGFFKTAYYFGKPFVFFIILTMVFIGAAEVSVHIPAFKAIGDSLTGRIAVFAVCTAIFASVTVLAYRRARINFNRIDL